MTKNEASLIARMETALISEGVHHWMHSEEQRDTDVILIREAVKIAWPELTEAERRTLRHWRPGT